MHRLIAPALLLAAGCSFPSPPPRAEFLIAARDATYWVTTGREGVKLRSSPLVLARSAGRYYEVYTSELDRSYEGGLFVGERVYRRDLPGRDSTLIFEDSAVLSLSSAYGTRFPDAQPLAADLFEDEDVDVSVVGETDLLGVFGPYVMLEHRSEVDNGVEQRGDTVRRVIDVRTGAVVQMAAVLRDTAARDAVAAQSQSTGRWKNRGYEVIARYDPTKQATLLVMRDMLRREWPIGYVRSSLPRVFWLDNPKVEEPLRDALKGAFDKALRQGTRWILA